MANLTDVRWTFLPGDAEGDSFAYLDDVRLALRDIRLAGARSVTPLAEPILDLQGLGPVIRTYLIPLEPVVGPVFRAGAQSWLTQRSGRRLRLSLDDHVFEGSTADAIESQLQDAIASR